MRSDDLAPLLAAQPPEGVGFRQGIVRSWNPLTAENTVEVGGTVLTNLPTIASSAEVLIMQPGDVVGIQVVNYGGSSVMYIIGRITKPADPKSATALAMFGIKTAEILLNESTNSLLYTDLTTVGPTVADVSIGPTRRCLVMISAAIMLGGATAGGHDGLMSYAVSGATVRPAQDGVALSTWRNNMVVGEQLEIQASRVSIQEGLTSGLHTFTAKYRTGGFSGDPAQFNSRRLIVIPF